MSRQYYGSWGAELDAEEFANALAASGTNIGDRAEQPEPRDDLRTHEWWPLAPDLSRPRNARELADKWQEHASGGPIRLAVEHLSRHPSYMWLLRTLRRAEGVVSVCFDAPRASGPQWDWPLDVGVLDDADGHSILDGLRNLHYQRFTRPTIARDAVAPLDVLLVPDALPQAAATLLAEPSIPRAHTIIATGGLSRAEDDLLAFTLREHLQARVIIACEVELDDIARWLDDVLVELSHNRPLDWAVFDVLGRGGSPPFILGDWRDLHAARASTILRRMTSRAIAANGGGAAGDLLPPGIRRPLGIEAGYPLEAIGELRTREELPWDNESDTATRMLELAEKLEERLIDRPDGRRVQGQLRSLADDSERVLKSETLRAGAPHRLDIRIGKDEPDWTPATARFPEDRLPPDAEGHLLTIVFAAPDVLDEPQTAEVWLPTYGDSDVAQFHFVARADVGLLDGRVTVLHDNRILQTLSVTVSIGDREPRALLRIAPETVLHARLDRLGGGPRFDAALLFNDAQGEHGLTAFVGSDAAYIPLRRVGDFVTRLRNELEGITDAPSAYATTESDATQTLLLTLARGGVAFRTALSELPALARVLPKSGGRGPAKPLRLQVLSLHQDDVLPIEFCYDGRTPSTKAKLCPNWRAALASGGCQSDCPADERTRVCPLAFWGFNHVIERRLWHPDDAEVLQARGADFAVGAATRNRAALTQLRHVLFGKATKAATFDRDAFEASIDDMRVALRENGAKLASADAWDMWADRVKADDPEVLMLLGHTQDEFGATTLELGTGSIAAAELSEEHVRTPPPAAGTPGPVVFLLACRSAEDNVPFSGFTAAFRRAKASCIIATLSTVRGRHMAPAAKIALNVLLRRLRGNRCSMGELMVQIRRELLRSDLPVGLAFIGFGDVDWQVGAN